MGAYTNAHKIAADMRAGNADVAAKVFKVVRHHGMLLQTKVKANASGRPGPRVITGDYRRSWTTNLTRIAGGGSATVGTNKPQARRLEYGFVGQDRIGRYYNQPPFPHAAKAVDVVEPGFIADLGDIPTLG